MRHAYQYVLAAALACFLFFTAGQAATKEVKVILYNGKSMQGDLVEETEDHVIILTDLGQIKTRRSAIESILYLPNGSEGGPAAGADSLDEQPLNDLVVVHLTNGETASGQLISKSLESILLKAEWGRLTIPKIQVKLIEYVNSEFAERGEPVTARLTAGNVLQGYIYHEDRNSVTLQTSVGRLTLDKKQLRSLEYHTAIKPPKAVRDKREQPLRLQSEQGESALQSAYSTRTEQPGDLERRQDSFYLGYAPNFGESYHTGLAAGYTNRYLIRRFDSFSLNASAQLGFSFFSLNKDLAESSALPGSMTAKGGAMVTTLSLGTPIHFFPTENPAYVFILRPGLETHLVYTSLQKSYPSFPSLNTEERATKFRYGLGTEVGLEWAINPRWSAGFSFAMHFIASEDDFNTFSISVGTQLY